MTEPLSERYPIGLLDMCVLVDLAGIEDARLPVRARISTVTVAELGLGVASAATPAVLALCAERRQRR